MKSAVAFALAWMTAWCQVVLVATMPWSALATSLNPLADVPICHADAQQGQQPSQPTGDSHDCVLCAICQAHGPAFVDTASAPTVLSQRVAASVQFALPQQRAVPPHQLIAAQPRGPPSPI
jgi:Protein of unknown function (DUF2946)